MNSLQSIKKLLFCSVLVSSFLFIPIKGFSALLLFQVTDTNNPMLLSGMFSVDDSDSNYGTGFQPLVDWAFFDMEGIPGIYTPVDTVINATAFINLSNFTLSTLDFSSIDTVIPPTPPSGNSLTFNPDNTWASNNINGSYIVRLIRISEPKILSLFLMLLLACLIFYKQKPPLRK
ncbi:hypothetical protein [Spartinivicinus ruber]|uniref:hypothetical protein n=1 Tax=Spartinivicinus ruber TaxID=2683272 RepID=UPI0013D07A1E|nr:hypothetical protein [Spartinivicinus ruber]